MAKTRGAVSSVTRLIKHLGARSSPRPRLERAVRNLSGLLMLAAFLFISSLCVSLFHIGRLGYSLLKSFLSLCPEGLSSFVSRNAVRLRTVQASTGVALSVVSLFFVHLHADPMLDTMRTLRGAEANPQASSYARPPWIRGRFPVDITRGDTERMELSITFDGGSHAGDAELILDTLRQRNVRTTIFLTGSFIKKYPDIVRRMVRDGHEIGNHTMTHPHLTEFTKNRSHKTLPWITREVLAGELRETARLFTSVTGRRMAPLWRAPYGEINAELREWAYAEGYLHVGWTSDHERKESLDTLDWVSDSSSELYLTSSEIKARILNFNRDTYGLRGGIILMHLGTARKDDRPAERLGEIIDELRERGYRFVKASTLVEHASRAPAMQLAAGSAGKM